MTADQSPERKQAPREERRRQKIAVNHYYQGIHILHFDSGVDQADDPTSLSVELRPETLTKPPDLHK